MSKSYEENIRQHKKNNPSKVLRVRYEEEEAEQDIKSYLGNSFLILSKEESNEDL